jgi:tetratricopeptide (TPR) repeat protein
MQFAQLPLGQSLTLDDGTGPTQRRILRKTAAGLACDAAGRAVALEPSTPIIPLGNHTLERAVFVLDAGEWRLALNWRDSSDTSSAARWHALHESENPASALELRRVRNQLASNLQARGRVHDAIEIYDELLDEREEAAIYNNRGAALMSLGRPEAALLDYGRAIELDPLLPQAYSNRGNALTKLGRLDEALIDYDRALDLDDSLAAVYCNRGLTRKLQGDLTSGLHDFDRALNVDPAFSPGYLARGGVRALKGDVSGAIKDLERYLELSPTAEQATHARVALQRLRAALK